MWIQYLKDAPCYLKLDFNTISEKERHNLLQSLYHIEEELLRLRLTSTKEDIALMKIKDKEKYFQAMLEILNKI